MAVCGTATWYVKVGLVIHFLGTIFFTAGFGTNAWMAAQTTQTSTDVTIGLFRMTDCSGGSCNSQDITDTYKNGSRVGTIAMMAITMVLITATLIMYSIYLAVEKSRGKCYAIAIICCEFTQVLFIVVAMIIWLVQIPSGFFASYSLGLITLSACLFIGAGCLLIADIRQMKVDRIVRKSKRVVQVTPPPVYDYSPPPKYITPSPEPYTRRPRQWDDRKFHAESSLDNYPIHDTPTPRTPQRVRVHIRSTTPASVASTSLGSHTRYGTPKFSQRYDYRRR